MKNKNFKKRLSLAIAAIAIGLSASALTSNTVHADGGSGGGGGGTGGTGYWRKVYGAPGSGQAWRTFSNRTAQFAVSNGWSGYNTVTRWVTNAGNNFGNGNLLNQCQQSRYIWYYGDGWDLNPWYPQGAYTNTAPWAEGRPGASDWNDFMGFGGGNWGGGITVLICSGSYERIERKGTDTEERTLEDETTFDGVYSSSTLLTPIVRDEYKDYPIEKQKKWNETHERQVTDEKLSRYGTWYNSNIDNIKKLNTLKGDDFKRLFAQLKAGAANATSGDYIPHQNIVLSKKNRLSFADGGVINISEQNRKAKVVISQKTVQSRNRAWTQRMNANGTWGPKQYTDGPWTEKSVESKKPSTQQLSSPVGVSFWQMIHAKCNQPGMNNVKSNVPDIIDPTNNTNTASQTLNTKTYTRQTDLPLGQTAYQNKDVAKTAYDQFYNETAGCQMVIDCISNPIKDKNKNDAVNNVQDTGDKRENTYGAQSDATINDSKPQKLSSDAFTFFRDNQDHTIRMDLWYPVVNDVNSGVIADTNKAIYTKIIFDPNGTPSDNLVTAKVNTKEILSGDDIKNSKGYLGQGEITKLDVAGQWASKPSQPHRFNAEWVTEPTVKNIVTTEVNGTGPISGKTETDTSKIRVYCSMNLNTKDAQKPTVDNNATSSNPVKGYDKFDPSKNHSVAVEFIRSGSGLNQ